MPAFPEIARKRICVDMDEVMADATSEHLARYNREFGEQITVADLNGRWLWDIVAADRHHALEGYLRSEDFFADLAVMPDAPRVLAALSERYDVYIATAAMEVPTSFAAKFRWLARHFPFIPPAHIVFCGNKSILKADFLIDDNPRQLRRFQGQGILYHSYHNTAVMDYPRVHDWLEIEKMFFSDSELASHRS